MLLKGFWVAYFKDHSESEYNETRTIELST